MTLDGTAPPVEHGLAGDGALSKGAIEPALEQLRGRAVVVFEEQRLAERHEKVDVVAGVEAGDADGAESRARRRQIGRVGALAVALQVRARENDGGGIGGGRCLLRREGRVDRAVELPLVVERTGPGQIGSSSPTGAPLSAMTRATTSATDHQPP